MLFRSDKTIAFAPSLSREFRERNFIKQSPNYIETVDVIQNLQKQGWNISGVCESRKPNRKIDKHYVKLEHPDFSLYQKNKKEGVTNVLVSNGCDGKSPLDVYLGVFRLVCSNGLVSGTQLEYEKIKHTQYNQERLPQILNSINNRTKILLEEYNRLKYIPMTIEKAKELAFNAARLRFGNEDIDTDQLLTVRRKEDEGNDLWTIYNVIQENLIKEGLLVNRNGNVLTGVNNMSNNIKLNQDLYQLVEAYA